MSKKDKNPPPPPKQEPWVACGQSVTVYDSTTGKIVQRSCIYKRGHGGSHYATP